MHKYRSCDKILAKNREQGFNLYFQGANKQFAAKNDEILSQKQRPLSRKYQKYKKAPLFQNQQINQKRSFSIHNKNKWVKHNTEQCKQTLNQQLQNISTKNEIETPKKIKRLIPLFQNVKKEILFNKNKNNEFFKLVDQTHKFHDNPSFLDLFKNIIVDYQNKKECLDSKKSFKPIVDIEEKSNLKTVRNSQKDIDCCKKSSIQSFESSFNSYSSLQNHNKSIQIQEFQINSAEVKKLNIQQIDDNIKFYSDDFKKLDIYDHKIEQEQSLLRIFFQVSQDTKISFVVMKKQFSLKQQNEFLEFSQNDFSSNFKSYYKNDINKCLLQQFLEENKQLFQNEQLRLPQIKNDIKQSQYLNKIQNLYTNKKKIKSKILNQYTKEELNEITNQKTQISEEKLEKSLEESQLSIIQQIKEIQKQAKQPKVNERLNILRIKRKLEAKNQTNKKFNSSKFLVRKLSTKKSEYRYKIKNNLKSQKLAQIKHDQIMLYSHCPKQLYLQIKLFSYKLQCQIFLLIGANYFLYKQYYFCQIFYHWRKSHHKYQLKNIHIKNNKLKQRQKNKQNKKTFQLNLMNLIRHG